MAGETRPEALELAQGICVQIGQYFQIQDDFLDCYGDPEVIGKVGPRGAALAAGCRCGGGPWS
jgi:farnesyl diphosphate synthase